MCLQWSKNTQNNNNKNSKPVFFLFAADPKLFLYFDRRKKTLWSETAKQNLNRWFQAVHFMNAMKHYVKNWAEEKSIIKCVDLIALRSTISVIVSSHQCIVIIYSVINFLKKNLFHVNFQLVTAMLKAPYNLINFDVINISMFLRRMFRLPIPLFWAWAWVLVVYKQILKMKTSRGTCWIISYKKFLVFMGCRSIAIVFFRILQKVNLPKRKDVICICFARIDRKNDK